MILSGFILTWFQKSVSSSEGMSLCIHKYKEFLIKVLVQEPNFPKTVSHSLAVHENPDLMIHYNVEWI